MNRRKIDNGFLVLLVVLVLVTTFTGVGLDLNLKSVWPAGLWVALLLSPCVYYAVARRIYPDLFPPRFRLTPFCKLDDRTPYRGESIARLLELELRPPVRSESEPKAIRVAGGPIRVRMPEEQSLPPSITLAGTTIPLGFFWRALDRWMFGPIQTVEGIIGSSDTNVTLEAWTTDGRYRWKAQSLPRAGADLLSSALQELSDMIRLSFHRYLELAEDFEDQGRVGLAVEMRQKLPKQGLELGYLYLRLGQIEDAAKMFSKLEEPFSVDCIRGLALAKVARGRYDEAKALLQDQLSDELWSKSDVADILMFKSDFSAARTLLDQSTQGLVQRMASRLKVASNDLEERLERLKEEELVDVYPDLFLLAEVLGRLGRCCEEIEDADAASRHYLACHNVLLVLNNFKPAHQSALDIGLRLEDLGLYSQAVAAYDESIEDAAEVYRNNPNHFDALTNLAWALAGKLACLNLQIGEALENVEDDPLREQVLDCAQELTSILSQTPEEQWLPALLAGIAQFTPSEREEPDKPVEGTKTPELEAIGTALAPLFEGNGTINVSWLMISVRMLSLADETSEMSEARFLELSRASDACNIAEGYFGAACLYAIQGDDDQAIDFLQTAILYLPEIRNRAKLDKDLRSLSKRQDFAELVSWSGYVEEAEPALPF